MSDIQIERPISALGLEQSPVDFRIPSVENKSWADAIPSVGTRFIDHKPGGRFSPTIRPGRESQRIETLLESEPVVGPLEIVFNLCRARGDSESTKKPEYYRQLLNHLDNYFKTNSGRISGINLSQSMVTEWTEMDRAFSSFDDPDENKRFDAMSIACQEATDPKVDNRGKHVLVNIFANRDVGATATVMNVRLDDEEKVVGSVLAGDNWASQFSVLTHEILHRWLRHTKFKKGVDSDGNPIYDYFATHWSPMGDTLWKTHEDEKFGHIPVQMTAGERLIMGWGKNVVQVADGQRQNINLAYLSLDGLSGQAQTVLMPVSNGYLIIEARRPVQGDWVEDDGIVIHFFDGEEFELLAPGSDSNAAWKPGMTFSLGDAIVNIGQAYDGGVGFKLTVQNGKQPTPTVAPTREPYPRPTERPPHDTRPNKIFFPLAGKKAIK